MSSDPTNTRPHRETHPTNSTSTSAARETHNNMSARFPAAPSSANWNTRPALTERRPVPVGPVLPWHMAADNRTGPATSTSRPALAEIRPVAVASASANSTTTITGANQHGQVRATSMSNPNPNARTNQFGQLRSQPGRRQDENTVYPPGHGSSRSRSRTSRR